MRIIVYTPIPPRDLTDALGEAEYSYRFVLAHFQPALEQLGEVVSVTDPASEVDPLYRESQTRGEQCVFLCFAPPHRAPVGLECPTSTVVAWEFDTIPAEEWDGEPRNDWTKVFADHGRAVVLSRHSAKAVADAMGSDFPVAAIPTPIFDRFSSVAPAGRGVPTVPRSVKLQGQLIDQRDYEITDQAIRRRPGAQDIDRPRWRGESRTLEFVRKSEDRSALVGFYNAEDWGTWTRIEQPWILLPFTVKGRVRLRILGRGYAGNVGHTITVSLGDARQPLTLTGTRTESVLDFHVTKPTSTVQFEGIRAEVPDGANDVRTMGLGIARLTVERPPGRGERLRALGRRIRKAKPTPALSPREQPLRRLDLDGVVFTSVLNPGDGRKNWESMVTAFCYAFRDTADATLVLKMTHHSIASFFTNLQYQLHRIGNVACRVVAVHGYLPDEEYTHLMEVTTFYANASRGEGMCMPLMEFMTAGVPAVSTHNTAMADYVSSESAFLVASSPVFAQWPHDDRAKIRTRYNRVDWQSLSDAFREAYDVAKTDPQQYEAMSRSARAAMEVFCSDKVVVSELAQFFGIGDRS